ARPRAARDEADAGAAAQLALRLGHVARAALVAAGDEADPLAMLVEAVERGEEALAGNTECRVDALRDERLDQDVAGGTGAWGGGGHGVERVGVEDGDESVPRRRGGAAAPLRVPPDSPNSRFGELCRHGLANRRRRRRDP